MHCAVIGCTTHDQSEKYKNEIFFRFPKDVNMCKAWKYACGRSDDFSTSAARICELHFDKSDYEKEFRYDGSGFKLCCSLKSYAIPTLNLSKLSGNVGHNIIQSDRTEITERTYFNKNVAECVENEEIYDSSKKKCAVLSCKAQDKLIFDFPNPKLNKKAFLEWMSLCKRNELKNIPYEEINNLYGICDAHFDRGTLNLPDSSTFKLSVKPEPSIKEEIYEPSQLCRLCFNVGTVNVFSCKYYKKVLKDIIQMFLPIEIKTDDISTLICQSCKCEAIRFYNFLLKSLQVDEYFQAITREISSENDNNSNSIVLVEPNISLIKVKEKQDQPSLKSNVSEAIIIDDVVEDCNDNRKNDTELPLLRKCLTSAQKIEEPLKKIETEIEDVVETILLSDEEENEYQVPNYVMDFFHTYVKGPNKKRVTKVSKQISSESNLEELCISYPEDTLEVQILEYNDQNDSIVCIHCNKVIQNIDDFNEHCQLENHAPLFACPVCNRIFNKQVEMEEHCEAHKKNELCICDRCGKQFTKRESLYAHLNFVHSKNDLKYECNVCTKKFATNYRLKLHMRVHNNDRPYCCEKCGAVFTMLAYLRNHQTIHSDYRPHKCLICNKGFRRRHKLAIHLTMHTGERKYNCEKCGISYKRKVNLNRHNRKHHTNPNEETEERPRNCTQCDFVCNFSAQLKIHMLKVHKSYTCTICNMSFSNYQPYYNHKFKHNPNKKKFVCKYCNKRFINANLLNVHMVVHTGKKNYQCELCKKRFSQRPHLQSHLLIHTGEKPHKCRHCPKSFAHLSTLVVHERIHTGETPYVCQFCNKGFGHLTNYKKHVFSQHGVVTPKTRDYSSFKKVVDIKDEENDDPEAFEIDHEEYIIINEELIKSEACEIINDSNSVLGIVEEVV